MPNNSPKQFSSILEYLQNLIQYRVSILADTDNESQPKKPPKLPVWKKSDSPLASFRKDNKLSFEETAILFLALAPHIQPDFLDRVFKEALPDSGNYPQIGGIRGKDFRGFLPTGETIMFLLAGEDLQKRFEVQKIFQSDHLFANRKILYIKEPNEGEPLMSGQLILNPDYVELFTMGHISAPHFSLKFPARRVETALQWSDLVLPDETLQQIKEMEIWLKHGKSLMKDWGMEGRLKPGYRVLFHGPPGTGKTLTATLLGKSTGIDVYLIDLSTVVSKFIGETEKNLASLFERAEDKNWILFFDEADALFGKRTNVRDAHDKYANQEVSYLLQRLESFNGLVILASNFKSNIDEAFTRRFQSIVNFTMPAAKERLCIWQNAFPPKAQMAKDVDLEKIAHRFELSGSNIMNVVQYVCLQALANGTDSINSESIFKGIERELFLEGRMIR